MKRNWDIGSPYLNSFSIRILPNILLFNKSSIETKEMQLKTNFTNLFENPNMIRILMRITQSILR